MDADTTFRLIGSILLVLTNAFVVAAEYGLVSARRARIESFAKRGSRGAQTALDAMDNIHRYIAGTQIAITMAGIGIGAITEPLITRSLEKLIGPYLGTAVSVVLSVLIVTFVVVVVGELVPKYVALSFAERVAIALVYPLKALITLFHPLVVVVQAAGRISLKLLKIDMDKDNQEQLTKQEIMGLVRSGAGRDGAIGLDHAQVVNKALRFDEYSVDDVMIHRLDIRWIDIESTREDVLAQFSKQAHTRMPVCRGDIDDIVGILYVQDLMKSIDSGTFNLEAMLRPAEVVPENLTLTRSIERMRDARTHMLIVVDEYGGTSGLLTLEDVVEEVFGELDDQNEAERPTIERLNEHRLSVRADVRYDEVCAYLGRSDDSEDLTTDTLAQIIVDQLGRMPKLGDAVETEIGTLRVENMARRRITRVWVQTARETDGAPS